MLIKISLVFYLLLSSYALYSQDSVKHLNNSKTVSTERTLNRLDEEQKLYDEAVSLLKRSKSDLAVEKLFQLLNSVGPESKIIDKINISISEGYRQRQEYKKGLDLLYKTIAKPETSEADRTYAYTRIAAIYNEGNIQSLTKMDSAVKYSNLAIASAEKNSFTDHLATAQNELGYIYFSHFKDYFKAKELLSKSLANFLLVEMYQDAACVGINLSKLYADEGEYQSAEKAIDEAMNCCELQGNENLFMRLYLQKAYVSSYKQDYKTAFNFLYESRKLLSAFFKDRLDENIFEMSAKFETEKKELENLELRKDNEIQSLKLAHKNSAITYLTMGVIIFFILLIVIYILFRKRSIAWENLLSKNMELAQHDKKILESGEFIPLSSASINEKDQSTENHLKKDLEIIKKLNKYLAEEKPYLNSSFSIEDVAARIGSNRTYISNAVNRVFDKNFSCLINEFRIRAARQMITDKKYDHFSLHAVAEMVGYSSRTSFINNFKKSTGLTPSYFRESMKK